MPEQRTVYLLVGLMGSGKSGWARRFAQRNPKVKIVSGDAFRTMLHGQYKYDEAMDDAITKMMAVAISELLTDGHDVVVDVGNGTHERRSPWLTVAKSHGARKVAVVFPQKDRDWHVRRRLMNRHGGTDPGAIYDAEIKAFEPIDEGDYDEVVRLQEWEVTRKKILILTASPTRDKHIDMLIAGKLRGLGHEVMVHPCLRGGRQAVLDFRPDIVLLPPIRNPNSRDFAEELKRFGCAVVTRHTEPSCSWQDWKKMTDQSKTEVLGAYPYEVDVELVWSSDEADILNRRGRPFKAVPVGAIGLDIYFDETIRATMPARADFCRKYDFDPDKPILLISSPWGFADSAPDLRIDDVAAARQDTDGRAKHLQMIEQIVPALKETWNILMTIHAGVKTGPYDELAKRLGIPLDSESPMMDMLVQADALIHAGSTAAVSAHILDVPAFQYGDVNAASSTNWWGVGESAISRVSPRFEKVDELIAAIRSHPPGSNANAETIEELEEGRYGVMDGKAATRAADIINTLEGQFILRWPRSIRDYRQLTMQRSAGDVVNQRACNVCGELFVEVRPEYLAMAATAAGVDPKKFTPPAGFACPWCAAKLVRLE